MFTVIGDGDIDFPAFLKTLLKNGYSGWSVVEQDVKFGHTAIPPKDSVEASLNYLKGVVDHLGLSGASAELLKIVRRSPVDRSRCSGRLPRRVVCFSYCRHRSTFR